MFRENLDKKYMCKERQYVRANNCTDNLRSGVRREEKHGTPDRRLGNAWTKTKDFV